MNNPFKKQNTDLDFSSLSTILTSGAAVGMAIANHLRKNPQTGGMIGVGLSLLVTGIMTALEDEIPTPNSEN